MRSRYHTNYPCWAVRLNSDPLPMPVVAVQVSALDLPGEQKFGLVFLRKSGPDSLASKLCARLDEQGIPFPRGAHWTELRSEGYVIPSPTGHKLTPKGHAAASDIMRDLAKKYGLHDIAYSSSSGLMVRCACAEWHAGPFPKTRSGQLRADAAANGHLREVKAGRWEPQRLKDFLNEVAPPQLNFTSTSREV